MIEFTAQMNRAPVNYAKYDEFLPTMHTNEQLISQPLVNLNVEPVQRTSRSTSGEISSRHSVATSPIRFVASKTTVERLNSPSPPPQPVLLNNAQIKTRNETKAFETKKEDLNQLSFRSTSTNRTFRQQENDILLELIDVQNQKTDNSTKPIRAKINGNFQEFKDLFEIKIFIFKSRNV